MAFRTHTPDGEVRDGAVRDVDAPVVSDERSAVVERRTHEYPPWSPAQIIGLVLGIGMTVLGIAAVTRTGFDSADIYQPHLEVWGMPHSPLLGVCEIAFGALMILASIIPGALRWLMALLGAISLGFGIVILTEAARSDLTRWFAVDDSNGWLFTIVGAVALLTAMFAPVFFPRRDRLGERDVVDVRDTAARRV